MDPYAVLADRQATARHEQVARALRSELHTKRTDRRLQLDQLSRLQRKYADETDSEAKAGYEPEFERRMEQIRRLEQEIDRLDEELSSREWRQPPVLRRLHDRMLYLDHALDTFDKRRAGDADVSETHRTAAEQQHYDRLVTELERLEKQMEQYEEDNRRTLDPPVVHSKGPDTGYASDPSGASLFKVAAQGRVVWR
jgi:hypothetical protein